MFEANQATNPQQTPANNPAPAQNKEPSTSAEAAGDKVEDIFADTDNSPAPAAPQAAPAQAPIAEASASALTGGKLRPAAEQAQGVPTSQVSGAEEPHFPFKKLIIIIGISVGIISIAGAAFYILKNRTASAPEPELSAPQESESADNAGSATEDTEPASPEDQGNAIDNFQEDRINRALNPIPEDLASKDTDQDGLSDAKEFDIGTNYRLVDSDNDSLSDWEEFAIFGTDPLDRDSDKDSYMDGEEVQNGYNPLGQGKLLNFEAQE